MGEVQSLTSARIANRAFSQFSIEYVVDFLLKGRTLLGNDFDAVTILLVIMTQTMERAFRLDQDNVRRLSWHEPLPADLFVPISRLAIAAITGLPKETVRRKVAKLERLGLVVKTGSRGVIVSQQLLTSTEMMDLIGYNHKILERLLNRLYSLSDAESDLVIALDEPVFS